MPSLSPKTSFGALFSALLALALGKVSLEISPAQAAEAASDPVAAEFPSQYFPENAPDPALGRFFPQEWTTYAANTGRNAVFSLPPGAPALLQRGVSWRFAGAGAIPLDGPPLAGDFKTTAYTIGMPVGVSVVDGMVYVGDDNGYTYALNALTGRLVWSHYGWNMTMSNPLVIGDAVVVSTGNAYFNYENTMVYLNHGRPVRGPGLNTIYALDRKTGREIWAYHTPGEAMPTAFYDKGRLFIGTGDGHVYALAADSGKLVWKTDIQSFVSMSSPVGSEGRIVVGGTDPNFLYALDEETGKIVWKISIPDLVATGMGDCTPAAADGVVVQEVTIRSGDPRAPVANVILGISAQSGQILWQKRLSNGPVPPAMKTATPVIEDGVVYEGSPVSGEFYALALKTGKELWHLALGSPIRAGAAIRDGVAYVPYRAGDIAAIRLKDGHLLHVTHIGGAFGPSSPVIVGGTLYVSNVYGWVFALPVAELEGEAGTHASQATP
jgi:polyvinyl alcohol dehydrogenase (cytochrome)